jgi:uncharacterized protein (TIGR03083 family)
VEAVDHTVALSQLHSQGAAFGALLTGDALATEVPSCPGWTVADLARHLGGIHRWARRAVLIGPSREPEGEGPADADDLHAWFDEGLDQLVRTLAECDPDQPCWAFGEPATVRFWSRRQLHETALHHWDAATSLGQPVQIADDLAVDGIDEVMTMFLPRQLRLQRLAAGPETVELECDNGRRFLVTTQPSETPPRADVTVSGSPAALLLLIWRRIPLSDARLSVRGSRTAAETLLGKALTP